MKARRSEVFSLILESTFSFTHRRHAPHLILYTPWVPYPRDAIYTITSMPPAGSRGPVAVSSFSLVIWHALYLEFNPGLGDVCLAATSAGNLLSLSNLVPDSLSHR